MISKAVKIGISAALAIILFQVSNTFLVYRYFKFDFYITAIAIVFLFAGFFISRYQVNPKTITRGSNPLSDLTNKELSILKLIAEGKSNKEIAAVNFVEISTIKTHINNIYAKLKVQNRREAADSYRNSAAEKGTFAYPE